MALLKHLPQSLSAQLRSLGASLQAAIVFTSRGPQVAIATVEGAGVSVRLLLLRQSLLCRCTCSHARANSPCEHIAATILAADGEGLLSDVRRPLKLTIGCHANPESAREKPEPSPATARDLAPAAFSDWLASLHQSVPSAALRPRRMRPTEAPVVSRSEPVWRLQLTEIRNSTRIMPWPEGPSPELEILYLVDVVQAQRSGHLRVEVHGRARQSGGEYGDLRAVTFSPEEVAELADPLDRTILALMSQGDPTDRVTQAAGLPAGRDLASLRHATLIPLICSTGRARLAREDQLTVLRWDGEGPWQLGMSIDPENGKYVLRGSIDRGREVVALGDVTLLVSGFVVLESTIAALDDGGALPWACVLRRDGSVVVPRGEGDTLIEELYGLMRAPRITLPSGLNVREISPKPHPELRLIPDEQSSGRKLFADLNFDYEGVAVAPREPGMTRFDRSKRIVVRRDLEAEAAAGARLLALGARLTGARDPEHDFQIAAKTAPRLVRALVGDGWRVEGEGRMFRPPGTFHLHLRSNVDWMDLAGEVTYGDQVAMLPSILTALRRGDDAVLLGDGTFGLLPEAWLKKHGYLLDLGKVHGDAVRFKSSQMALIDLLVASQPEARVDKAFARAREQLSGFEGIRPIDPPPSFQGDLRPYQREGLGWLLFLRQFGFGGCLADDMGLGKTVQVLALLATKTATSTPAPSLIVVPRSLLFHWQSEAERFTPHLRVLVYVGSDRGDLGEKVLREYDLIITTYGTLRLDVARLKYIEFDYCILDESQAIKNPGSQVAKAARLLRSRHRLALSGTPIENHLGELWSLFEFLSPGMLGSAAAFKSSFSSGQEMDAARRAALGAALRPFFLRRTKEKVAPELPEKFEQTLACELGPAQRKQYDELRTYYRESLLAKVDERGIMRSKIHILEALLRLRQAACHPGLIDKKHISEPSAKLEVLLSHLTQVVEEGHKVLVFSQFTRFLDIIKRKLDAANVGYEYLDGATRDRVTPVSRFQTNPDSHLFLISLKAGGLGLNLTAAEYVYLLDPWWNPAVEAQAIDRAHRIGQSRRVFAYRLIAHDTIEEKVLALQDRKRDLADAIINADANLMRSLQREDLELLLS